MKNKNWLIGLMVVLAFCLGGFGMYYLVIEQGLLSKTVINKLEKEVTVNENGIADAVDKLYDAVVVIGSYKSNKLVAGGTGFVYKVTEDMAYLITNNHVIEGASKIEIEFTNAKTVEATLIGTDTYSDIAVLAVKKDQIVSVAVLGKSEDSRLGDTVFTIGAPLDLEYSWTVTRGVLSGKDRLVELSTNNTQVADWAMSVLQTDAAINSGNSGGPIANSNGEVIGVTNMKLVSSGVEGIAFAIPIEDAISVANQLIISQKIERPLLGVETMNIDDSKLLSQYGVTVDSSIAKGAIIGNVREGSVAAEAGLKKGDVIIKFGDYDVVSSARLKYYLYKYKIGDKVKLTYIRGTATETVTVTLSQKAN